MTTELLTLVKSNRKDEALEKLLDLLLGRHSNGMCSNIGECVSGACGTRNPKGHDATDSADKQGRMAQTAGD